MKFEWEYFIYLTRCGACGETPLPPSQDLDWQTLLHLAYEQNVDSLLTLALKKEETICPASYLQPLIAQLRGNAIQNMRRAEGWLDLLAKAEKQGLELLVMKGLDVARFYHNPECRVANDMDLLVRPQQEQEAFEFLQEHGFQMQARSEYSIHAVGSHPHLGVVELHVHLISERFCRLFSAQQLNESAFENVQRISLFGGTFQAMESTNALLYLTFHFIKHFLYSGISMKMMFDIALFAKNTLAAVDAVQYKECLQRGNYCYFMQTVFGIMVKYGGFEKEDFPLEPVENAADMDALLENMVESGAMGQKKEQDVQSAWMFYYYSVAKKENSQEDLANINTGQKIDFLGGLFPSAAVLSRKYPILLQKKWLYPFCWLHRLLTRGFAFLFSNRHISRRKVKEKQALSAPAQKKIELFEQFHMM
ncbi:MAG: nucleotidyltransferase family protein [Clostridia bacterium]|nr:nucleotidyltransferase family protein [Clostridia bacterium]